MSLGLPEFGSRGEAADSRGLFRVAQWAGLAALAWSLWIAASDGLSAAAADRAGENARREVARLSQSADVARKALARHSDLLVATASVESSPQRVLADLQDILPPGVSLVSLKVEYLPDASARVDLSVEARGPEAYDRFLSALSGSKRFTDIKPGSESRPGLVRATVTAVHRSGGAVR